MVLPLAKELQRRGHRVTLLAIPDAEASGSGRPVLATKA